MNSHIKVFFNFLAIVISLVFLNNANASQGVVYDRMVFFGDSLTDNGNLYNYDFGFLPKSPPYFQGRFSNGYVWSDIVADYFYREYYIRSANYAVGGETAIFHDPVGGFLPYTLTMSINNYLVHSMLRDRTKTLFIIWIGANDYLKGSDDVDLLTTNVINSIKTTIENLIYRGAFNFLIINMPDLSRTPFGIESTMSENLHALSVTHNGKLASAIAEIEASYRDVNIHLFDMSSLFTKLLDDPEYYNKKYNLNIKNISQSCWAGGYTLKKNNKEEIILQRLQEQFRKQPNSLVNSAKLKALEPEGFSYMISNYPALRETYIVSELKAQGVEPCINPDSYVFWDHLHPTAILHSMFSQILSEYIDQNYPRA